MSDYNLAHQLFVKKYGNRVNFVTPTIRCYGLAGGYAYEISEGTGVMDDKPIFGVTVINSMLGENNNEKSASFSSYEEALKYAKEL